MSSQPSPSYYIECKYKWLGLTLLPVILIMLSLPQAFSQIPKEPGISLADKAKIRAPLKRIDCDDEEKTMEALKLLSPEELASPRGLENDRNKAVKYVSQIIAAMRKPCYYKLKDSR